MHGMDAHTTPSIGTRESHVSRGAWLFPAVLFHLLAWLVAFGYLCFYVPRLRAVFEDVGVSLPQTAMAIIRLSGFVGVYWPVVAVFVAVVVIGVDSLIVFLTRSRTVRTMLLVMFLIPPIAWYVSCYVTMSQALAAIGDKLPYGG